jgi:uncharacterized protein (DUF433 family)
MPAPGRVEINPRVMLGKPVIRGTRITVELILRKLGEGATHKDLLEAYPHLSQADIQAAITYAADTIAHEETVLVESKGVIDLVTKHGEKLAKRFVVLQPGRIRFGGSRGD